MPASAGNGAELEGPLSQSRADRELHETTVLLTSVGSLYRLARSSDGRWWVSAEEPGGPEGPAVWRETRAPEPWPPLLQCPVRLLAPADPKNGTRGRCPGGRCWTAPVTAMAGEAARNGRTARFSDSLLPPERIPVGTEHGR